MAVNEFGADIYYTLDNSDPISGDELSPNTFHYEGPITISAETTLKFVAFDPSNNHSSVVTEQYNITNDPVAGQTAITAASVGLGTVTLNWAPADPGMPDADIVDYQVKVFTSIDASIPVTTEQTGSPDTSITIDGLTGDTPYWFTVSAKSDVNSAWGLPSAVYGPLTPQGAVVADAGADQSGVVRGTAVTLSGAGSSSAPDTTYKWTQLVTGASTRTEMPAGVDKVALTPSVKNASFTLPFFRYPMVNTPLTFELAVTFGDTVQDRCGRHHAPYGHRDDRRSQVEGTRLPSQRHEQPGRKRHHGAIVDRNGLWNRRGHRWRLGSPHPQRCPCDQSGNRVRRLRSRRHRRTVHRRQRVTLDTNII